MSNWRVRAWDVGQRLQEAGAELKIIGQRLPIDEHSDEAEALSRVRNVKAFLSLLQRSLEQVALEYDEASE